MNRIRAGVIAVIVLGVFSAGCTHADDNKSSQVRPDTDLATSPSTTSSASPSASPSTTPSTTPSTAPNAAAKLPPVGDDDPSVPIRVSSGRVVSSTPEMNGGKPLY